MMNYDVLICSLVLDVIVTGRQSQRIVSNGCSLKYSWCMSTPQISIVQLVIYSILISLAYPVMHLSQLVMMSEILSPRNQVKISV